MQIGRQADLHIEQDVEALVGAEQRSIEGVEQVQQLLRALRLRGEYLTR